MRPLQFQQQMRPQTTYGQTTAYAPTQTTDMLSSIMPLIILMMMMGMMMPMMKGMSAQTS